VAHSGRIREPQELGQVSEVQETRLSLEFEFRYARATLILEATLRKVPGLLSYTMARTADGGISVTVCRDKKGTEESVRLARDWISTNAGSIGASAHPTPVPLSARGLRKGLAIARSAQFSEQSVPTDLEHAGHVVSIEFTLAQHLPGSGDLCWSHCGIRGFDVLWSERG
jgi:hypothetical protein